MPSVPYPITAYNMDEMRTQVYRIVRDLYEERLGGLDLGDVFADEGDVLSLQVATAGGLEKSGGYLQIKNKPTGGLQSASTGEAIKCKASGGMDTDAEGLYIKSSNTKGYREGVIVTIKDTDELYIGSGAIDICGAVYSVVTTQTLSQGSLASSYLYYVYADAPATGIELAASDFTISATAPTWNDTYGAYYKTGDATKRMVAKFYTTAIGSLTNLALAGTATAQSQYDFPNFKAIFGNDNNTTTAWWGTTLNHWWKVDLGDIRTFAKLTLQTENVAYVVTVSGSNDDNTYTTIVTDPSATRASLTDLASFGTASYRYVKVVCSAEANVPTIREFQVWGYLGKAEYVANPIGQVSYLGMDSDNVLNDEDVLVYDTAMSCVRGIEKSTDTTLADDSDAAIPTEHAVKTYVDDTFVPITGGRTVLGIDTDDPVRFGSLRVGTATNYNEICAAGIQTYHGTTAKMKLTLRPGLIEKSSKAGGTPTQVYRGLNVGYSLPIWSGPAPDEELYWRMRIPVRWDGITDPQFGVCCSLASAEDVGDNFKFSLEWQTTNKGTIIGTTTSVCYSEQTVLAGRNAQYSTYFCFFTFDHDDATNPFYHGEMLQARVRRVDATDPDITGEVIIWDWASMWPVDKTYGFWNVSTNDA